MSLQVTKALALTAFETIEAGMAAAVGAVITHNGFNTAAKLSSNTVPPVTKMSAFVKALVAGAATIDLTALVGTAGVAVDGTGLKVQAIRIQNPSTNANAVAITPGASNGYLLLGTGWKITLNPGEEFVWVGIDHASVPDVAAGAKTIDLAGTGTQSFNVLIILG